VVHCAHAPNDVLVYGMRPAREVLAESTTFSASPVRVEDRAESAATSRDSTRGSRRKLSRVEITTSKADRDDRLVAAAALRDWLRMHDVDAFVAELLQSLCGDCSGRDVDFAQQIGRRFGITLICGALGANEAVLGLLEQWARTVMNAEGDWRDAATANRLLRKAIGSQLDEGLDPRALLALLSSRLSVDAPSTRARLVAVVRLLVSASYHTVSYGLSSILLMVLPDRPLWRACRDDAALVRAVVEEVLRLEPPVMVTVRTASGQVDLAGCPVAPGERVFVSIAAANRDPGEFREPDRFRADRFAGVPVTHVSFGYGSHACPGAQFARSTLTAAVSWLAACFPDLGLVDGASKARGDVLHGLDSLHVSFGDRALR
jgi:cytochrome P450